MEAILHGNPELLEIPSASALICYLVRAKETIQARELLDYSAHCGCSCQWTARLPFLLRPHQQSPRLLVRLRLSYESVASSSTIRGSHAAVTFSVPDACQANAMQLRRVCVAKPLGAFLPWPHRRRHRLVCSSPPQASWLPPELHRYQLLSCRPPQLFDRGLLCCRPPGRPLELH